MHVDRLSTRRDIAHKYPYPSARHVNTPITPQHSAPCMPTVITRPISNAPTLMPSTDTSRTALFCEVHRLHRSTSSHTKRVCSRAKRIHILMHRYCTVATLFHPYQTRPTHPSRIGRSNKISGYILLSNQPINHPSNNSIRKNSNQECSK